MSDAADKFRRKHFDDTNGVRWPSGDAAKTDVAQTLLGLSCVGNLRLLVRVCTRLSR